MLPQSFAILLVSGRNKLLTTHIFLVWRLCGFYYIAKVKKIFSIILVSLLLFNFAGLFLYFSVQLFRIHQEMKAKLRTIPDEKLEIFVMTLESFNNARVEEDEMELCGKMYDIARIKEQGETVKVYALYDAAEDNLLAFMDAVVKRPLQDKTSTPAQILQFISLTFLPPGQHPLFSLETCVVTANTHYVFSNFCCPLSIESPPPRS